MRGDCSDQYSGYSDLKKIPTVTLISTKHRIRISFLNSSKKRSISQYRIDFHLVTIFVIYVAVHIIRDHYRAFGSYSISVGCSCYMNKSVPILLQS